MGSRVFLKLTNWIATVVLVICFIFAIKGGMYVEFFNLDFTAVPRIGFIAAGVVAAIVCVVSDFYGKLAGNK